MVQIRKRWSNVSRTIANAIRTTRYYFLMKANKMLSSEKYRSVNLFFVLFFSEKCILKIPISTYLVFLCILNGSLFGCRRYCDGLTISFFLLSNIMTSFIFQSTSFRCREGSVFCSVDIPFIR